MRAAALPERCRIRKAAPGAAVTKGLAIHGSNVDGAQAALEKWVQEVKA